MRTIRNVFWVYYVAVVCLLGSALGGCAGGYAELDDEPAALEQGLGTKFSGLKTYGVSKNSTRSACTVANGGGVNGITYHHCMLPGTKAITYRVTGTDPYECPGPGCEMGIYNRSWKAEVQTTLSQLPSYFPGSGFTWTQVVLEPQTVKITSGDCPGDPVSSDNIQSFVCTTFPQGSNVTESLAGIYKRWDTGAVITVDTVAIQARAPNNSNGHQLLEHGIHAAMAQMIGIGTEGHVNEYWTDPRVDLDPGLGEDFDAAGYAPGDGCRGSNYTNASPGTFAALAGSCAN